MDHPPEMDAVWKAVSENRPIEAIRLYRAMTGASLKDARDTVEALRGQHVRGASFSGPAITSQQGLPRPDPVSAMERNAPPYLQPDSIEDIERRITHGGWQSATVPPAVWLIVLLLLGVIAAISSWPGGR